MGLKIQICMTRQTNNELEVAMRNIFTDLCLHLQVKGVAKKNTFTIYKVKEVALRNSVTFLSLLSVFSIVKFQKEVTLKNSVTFLIL